jgi:hypothetical protein
MSNLQAKLVQAVKDLHAEVLKLRKRVAELESIAKVDSTPISTGAQHVVMPSEHPQLIACRQLHLMDENGNLRLGMMANSGGVSMTMFDNTGKGRIQLTVDPENVSSLSVADGTGKTRIQLNADPATQRGGSTDAGIYYMDTTQQCRMASITDGSGDATHFLHDQSGTLRMLLGTGNSGSTIRLYDSNGKYRIISAVQNDGTITLPNADLQDRKRK